MASLRQTGESMDCPPCLFGFRAHFHVRTQIHDEQKKARYGSGLKSISKEETWRRQV
jgi:hypothetical protein